MSDPLDFDNQIEAGDRPSGLFTVLIVAAKNYRFLAIITLAAATLSGVCSLFVANVYTATTKVLPPQQSSSILSSMLGQLGPLSGFIGRDVASKGNETYIALLQSRTIADRLIQRFELKQVYKEKMMEDTRKKLAQRSDISVGKDGIISVSVEDWDPGRAADLANAYAEELRALNEQLSVSEATQRRAFFEKQMQAARDNLSRAEVDLKTTQESTGLIQLDSQAKAIIEFVENLRAHIAAKEVQYQSMRSFATQQNPELMRVEEELSALRSQLSKLERENNVGSGGINVPTGKVPAAGLEYVRKLRNVKYYEAIFELLAKQFEAAKIDEAKSSVLPVLDAAEAPERKSSPKRALIILISSTIAFLCGWFWLILREAYRNLQRSPKQMAKLLLIRSYLSSGL